MDRRTFITTSIAAAGWHSYRGDRPQAHAQPPSSIGHDSAGCHYHLRDDWRGARYVSPLTCLAERDGIGSLTLVVRWARCADETLQRGVPCTTLVSSAREMTGCQAGRPAGSLPAEYAFRQTTSPAAEPGAVV